MDQKNEGNLHVLNKQHKYSRYRMFYDVTLPLSSVKFRIPGDAITDAFPSQLSGHDLKQIHLDRLLNKHHIVSDTVDGADYISFCLKFLQDGSVVFRCFHGETTVLSISTSAFVHMNQFEQKKGFKT